MAVKRSEKFAQMAKECSLKPDMVELMRENNELRAKCGAQATQVLQLTAEVNVLKSKLDAALLKLQEVPSDE